MTSHIVTRNDKSYLVHKVEDLSDLAWLARHQWSVFGWSTQWKPSPASFQINLTGETLHRSLCSGLWVYPKHRCRKAAVAAIRAAEGLSEPNPVSWAAQKPRPIASQFSHSEGKMPLIDESNPFFIE